ncbi:hypothetical protein MP228_002307 [Amoeboaphelidium protococcarum]|nr:hypothetical protein MP228_002307 [Amoeboaphelidium protococcarum]
MSYSTMNNNGGAGQKRGYLAVIVGSVLTIAFLYISLTMYLHNDYPSRCQMTYMRPMYQLVQDEQTMHYKYGLYKYYEGFIDDDDDDDDDDKHQYAVLFLPGSGGSFKQVRSVASTVLNRLQHGDVVNDRSNGIVDGFSQRPQIEFYAVDFKEELSGLDGGVVERQAQYAHQVLQHLCQDLHFSKVLVFSHSMAGFVARTMFTLYGDINLTCADSLITLSTPHFIPPAPLDRRLLQLYWKVNGHVSQSGHSLPLLLNNMSILSISGGDMDKMVSSQSAYQYSDSEEFGQHYLHVETEMLDSVSTQTDHQSILWCNQLVVLLSDIIMNTVFLDTSQKNRYYNQVLFKQFDSIQDLPRLEDKFHESGEYNQQNIGLSMTMSLSDKRTKFQSMDGEAFALISNSRFKVVICDGVSDNFTSWKFYDGNRLVHHYFNPQTQRDYYSMFIPGNSTVYMEKMEDQQRILLWNETAFKQLDKVVITPSLWSVSTQVNSLQKLVFRRNSESPLTFTARFISNECTASDYVYVRVEKNPESHSQQLIQWAGLDNLILIDSFSAEYYISILSNCSGYLYIQPSAWYTVKSIVRHRKQFALVYPFIITVLCILLCSLYPHFTTYQQSLLRISSIVVMYLIPILILGTLFVNSHWIVVSVYVLTSIGLVMIRCLLFDTVILLFNFVYRIVVKFFSSRYKTITSNKYWTIAGVTAAFIGPYDLTFLMVTVQQIWKCSELFHQDGVAEYQWHYMVLQLYLSVLPLHLVKIAVYVRNLPNDFKMLEPQDFASTALLLAFNFTINQQQSIYSCRTIRSKIVALVLVSSMAIYLVIKCDDEPFRIGDVMQVMMIIFVMISKLGALTSASKPRRRSDLLVLNHSKSKLID